LASHQSHTYQRALSHEWSLIHAHRMSVNSYSYHAMKTSTDKYGAVRCRGRCQYDNGAQVQWTNIHRAQYDDCDGHSLVLHSLDECCVSHNEHRLLYYYHVAARVARSPVFYGRSRISDPFSRLPGGGRREEQISRILLVKLSRHSDDTVTR